MNWLGRINGKYGNVHWTPILYQYRSLRFNELIAAYSLSEVALVTPLRDGMNLIAKEFLASRTRKTGVLILSEMAARLMNWPKRSLLIPITSMRSAMRCSPPCKCRARAGTAPGGNAKKTDELRCFPMADDFPEQPFHHQGQTGTTVCKTAAANGPYELLDEFHHGKITAPIFGL
jgi:hypothetical protein